MARIDVLLEAKDMFGLSDEIDAFAQGLFPDVDGGPGYQAILSDYQDRFIGRRETVIARLESGRHPRVVDPSVLAEGTPHAETYARRHERLQAEASRLDEVFTRLAEYDQEQVAQLVVVGAEAASPAERDDVLDQARVEMLLFEEALDASDTDPAVQRMLAVYDQQEPDAVFMHAHGDVDFLDAMSLVGSARRALDDQASAASLREFHAMGDMAR